MSELVVFEQWAAAMLAKVTPASRSTAMREVARELRRSQQARIAAQKNPDGSAYQPRKLRRTRDSKLRDKRSRIKRTAMFQKLRTVRYLGADIDGRGLAIGFSPRISRIARVHQYGERHPVAPNGPEYEYPSRILLGMTDRERDMVCQALLRHVAG